MSSNTESKDALTTAIENNPCGRCRAAGNPSCKCGGGKGGGGSGGGNSVENKKEDAPISSNHTADISKQMEAIIQKFDEFKSHFVQSQLLSDKTISYETGLLSIESDRLRGNLCLRVKAELSKDETEIAKQFLTEVKNEFDEFKNLLTEKGVSTNNFTSTPKENELSVHILNPKYYNAFIKHLESKNLIPIANPEREEKKEALQANKEDKQSFNPNPLSTRFEKK